MADPPDAPDLGGRRDLALAGDDDNSQPTVGPSDCSVGGRSIAAGLLPLGCLLALLLRRWRRR